MSGKKVVKSPQCGSQRVWKAGVRYTRNGERSARVTDMDAKKLFRRQK
jgi:hypothetical protein